MENIENLKSIIICVIEKSYKEYKYNDEIVKSIKEEHDTTCEYVIFYNRVYSGYCLVLQIVDNEIYVHCFYTYDHDDLVRLLLKNSVRFKINSESDIEFLLKMTE